MHIHNTLCTCTQCVFSNNVISFVLFFFYISCKCPAHSQAFGSSVPALRRKSESTVASKEYAFEVALATPIMKIN